MAKATEELPTIERGLLSVTRRSILLPLNCQKLATVLQGAQQRFSQTCCLWDLFVVGNLRTEAQLCVT